VSNENQVDKVLASYVNYFYHLGTDALLWKCCSCRVKATADGFRPFLCGEILALGRSLVRTASMQYWFGPLVTAALFLLKQVSDEVC
jgi:hypothetical protein